MKKLQTKPLSLREETFALAFCACACGCGCGNLPCDCPIAPTHQMGLTAQATNAPESNSLNQDTRTYTREYDFFTPSFP